MGKIADFHKILSNLDFIEDTPENWPEQAPEDDDIWLLYRYHHKDLPLFKIEIYQMDWDRNTEEYQVYFYETDENGQDIESHLNEPMDDMNNKIFGGVSHIDKLKEIIKLNKS